MERSAGRGPQGEDGLRRRAGRRREGRGRRIRGKEE